MKLSYPQYNLQTIKKVQQVLKSGKVNYWTGTECKNFEKEFSRYIGNKYVLIASLFLIWMFYSDTNSFFIHNELVKDIEALEDNKAFYKEEIKKDKVFIEKMKDSSEVEKFAREVYFLKKNDEEIFIIEHQDSIKNKKNE